MSRHHCDFSENSRDKKKTHNHTLAFVYPVHFSQDLRRSRVVGKHVLLSLSSPNSWQFTDAWSTMTLAAIYTARRGKLRDRTRFRCLHLKYPPHPLWERASDAAEAWPKKPNVFWMLYCWEILFLTSGIVFDYWLTIGLHWSVWITRVMDGFWPVSTNM